MNIKQPSSRSVHTGTLLPQKNWLLHRQGQDLALSPCFKDCSSASGQICRYLLTKMTWVSSFQEPSINSTGTNQFGWAFYQQHWNQPDEPLNDEARFFCELRATICSLLGVGRGFFDNAWPHRVSLQLSLLRGSWSGLQVCAFDLFCTDLACLQQGVLRGSWSVIHSGPQLGFTMPSTQKWLPMISSHNMNWTFALRRCQLCGVWTFQISFCRSLWADLPHPCFSEPFRMAFFLFFVYNSGGSIMMMVSNMFGCMGRVLCQLSAIHSIWDVLTDCGSKV